MILGAAPSGPATARIAAGETPADVALQHQRATLYCELKRHRQP
jgi:hypothetical protein